ncbi:MAG TPA: polyphosphate kinase 2, partial [Sphingomonadaceae bacterium]|nr:polyphosphate kinase 2 [Sphingomonadaceae bacterium]
TKRWKLSPMDLESRNRWQDYSRAKDYMLVHTDIDQARWYVVNSDVKKRAHLNCIAHLLSLFAYQEVAPKKMKLPRRKAELREGYARPPLDRQNFVPEIY